MYCGCKQGQSSGQAARHAAVATQVNVKGSSQPAPAKVLVRLVDGSRLVGQTHVEEFELKTSYADLNVGSETIRSMFFADSGRAVTVECSNGDILHGIPAFSAFSISTSFGDFEISVKDLLEVTFHGPLPEVTEGLVAYYPFDGSVVDESGNHHDATNHGATPGVDRFGVGGKALEFNGSGAYVGIPDGLMDPAGDGFTWTAWASYKETSGVRYLFYGGMNTAESALSLNNGKIVFGLRLEPENNLGVSVVAPPPGGHVQITCVYRRGMAMQIWLNGILKGETPVPDGVISHGSRQHSAAIGSYAPEQQNHIRTYHMGTWFGSVDDFRIYNRALAPDEISTLAADH